MKYKQQKLLFLLSQNSRSSLKFLGQELKQSKQSTAYQIKQLEEKKNIIYKILIDYVRLGESTLLVGFRLRKYSALIERKIGTILKNHSAVLTVMECRQQYDFIIEIKARNLSHFNKMHVKFMEEYSSQLTTVFITPIVVRHSYPRNYLIRKNLQEDMVTLGDRETTLVSTQEEIILNELEISPKEPLLSIARKTKLGVKKITATKRKLEKMGIIRKYSCIIQDTSIRRQILFIDLDDEDYKNYSKLNSFAAQHPNCIGLYKVIGDYNVIMIIESLAQHNIIHELRERFSIGKYQMLDLSNEY